MNGYRERLAAAGQESGAQGEAPHEHSGTYAPGDLVVLRSGGPMLTVASVGGEAAHCIWFSTDDGLQRAEIPLSCLAPADGADLMMPDMDIAEDELGESYGEIEEGHRGRKKKKKKKGD